MTGSHAMGWWVGHRSGPRSMLASTTASCRSGFGSPAHRAGDDARPHAVGAQGDQRRRQFSAGERQTIDTALIRRSRAGKCARGAMRSMAGGDAVAIVSGARG